MYLFSLDRDISSFEKINFCLQCFDGSISLILYVLKSFTLASISYIFYMMQ
uniref:Uncharacterized protein n=1 Tax=Kalanchoe fedtschenkoi TaxID=63787 RepID=A0A7N0UJY4_KALFE